MKDLEGYKNAINNYLKSKNITDYTKYMISFKQDKLFFDKWEYPSIIERPVNIQPSPTVPSLKYYDTKTRSLVIQTTNNTGTLFINAFGEYVQQDSVNKVIVDNIIRTDVLLNTGWEYANFSGRMYVLFNGLIRFDNRAREKIKITILYHQADNILQKFNEIISL